MSYIEITEGDCTIRLDANMETNTYSSATRQLIYNIADAERALDRLRAAVTNNGKAADEPR